MADATTMKPSGRWIEIAVAAAAAFAVASVGSALTDLGPWYRALAKPSWQPPDWAFPVVWTTIFALTAAAGVIGWRRTRSAVERRWLIVLFAANGVLNAGWSGLFFTLRRLDWALVEAGLLWTSVLALILFLARFSRLAAWLLAPYLVWVGVAFALNWAVLARNPIG